jgi:integrase
VQTKVNDTTVEGLKCPPGTDRFILWDSSLVGFGVIAFPSGTKSYIIQYRQAGRSRRMKLGRHGRLTPKQARSKAKKYLGLVEDGTDPIAERQAERAARTLKEVSEEFMQLHVKAKRKAKTYASYNGLLNSHLLPALGSRALGKITRADAARLHAKMTDTPQSANRMLALLGSIWNWAARRDEVMAVNNPATKIERYPEKRRERFLSPEEFGRLGDALRLAETGLPWGNREWKRNTPKKRCTAIDPHAIAAIRLLVLTGARLREILDAKWTDVDFGRGLLLLRDSKTGPKPIYLGAPALLLLSDLPRVDGNPYIIAGHTAGKPRADLQKPWTAVSRAAELEGLRIHDLRHSYAATGAGANLGLPILGRLLGHSQPATTQRYVHLAADPMNRAADLIGGQIAAAMANQEENVVAFVQK